MTARCIPEASTHNLVDKDLVKVPMRRPGKSADANDYSGNRGVNKSEKGRPSE
jgi:hypothetical protein